MTDKTDDMIREFNRKHDLDVDSQFKQLMEEIGEFSEALNRDDGAQAASELDDVRFVARSIQLMMYPSGDCDRSLEQQARYNLEKSTAKDGDKVTDDA